VTVTRTELAVHVEAAFAAGPATRDQMLACAAGSRARPQIISMIRNMPDRTYSSLRDLWRHLGDLPIGG
jgi:hypothetical protein